MLACRAIRRAPARALRVPESGFRRFASGRRNIPLGAAIAEELERKQGLTHEQAKRVGDALRNAGASSESEQLMTLKAMGESGLASMLEAINREIEFEEGRSHLAKVSLAVDVPLERHSFTIEAREGDSLYDLVKVRTQLAEYLECACGGQMMCSTCHVYVDEESYAMMDPPEEAENDMLDLAFELREGSSRLGCQVKLRADLPNMKITVPEGVNNYFN
mmetsp:Transcript_13687/g.34747  ORF Transcript_13687/g.34747 Transcript_13687/m.34747 type:complete len:219 (+) Transcript_13687:170-826(+)